MTTASTEPVKGFAAAAAAMQAISTNLRVRREAREALAADEPLQCGWITDSGDVCGHDGTLWSVLDMTDGTRGRNRFGGYVCAGHLVAALGGADDTWLWQIRLVQDVS